MSSATIGWRSWTIFNVSAQLPQCAASRNLEALLNPKPPMTNGSEVDSLACRSLRVHPKKSAETTPDLLIVFHGKVGGQIRAGLSWCRTLLNSTIKQKQRRALKVFHLWDSLQELGVAGDDFSEAHVRRILVGPLECPEQVIPCSSSSASWTSSPHLGVRVNNSGGHFQLFTTGWANTTPIPDACLAVVHSNLGVAPQLLLQDAVHVN